MPCRAWFWPWSIQECGECFLIVLCVWCISSYSCSFLPLFCHCFDVVISFWRSNTVFCVCSHLPEFLLFSFSTEFSSLLFSLFWFNWFHIANGSISDKYDLSSCTIELTTPSTELVICAIDNIYLEKLLILSPFVSVASVWSFVWFDWFSFSTFFHFLLFDFIFVLFQVAQITFDLINKHYRLTLFFVFFLNEEEKERRRNKMS